MSKLKMLASNVNFKQKRRRIMSQSTTEIREAITAAIEKFMMNSSLPQQ